MYSNAERTMLATIRSKLLSNKNFKIKQYNFQILRYNHNKHHANEPASCNACWKCGKQQDCCQFFCKGCGKIQRVEGGACCNYFEILNM